MLDLCVHVLMRVTGRVDCFGYMCVCRPDSKIKYSVFYVYLCSCIILVCYFTGIFHVVVRQISMLFIDNKDSVFCKTVVYYTCNMTYLLTHAVLFKRFLTL